MAKNKSTNKLLYISGLCYILLWMFIYVILRSL